MSHGTFMDVMIRLCVRNIGHECCMCLKIWIYKVTCNSMTVFNHTPVCPGASPVMFIALRDLRFICLKFLFRRSQVIPMTDFNHAPVCQQQAVMFNSSLNNSK